MKTLKKEESTHIRINLKDKARIDRLFAEKHQWQAIQFLLDEYEKYESLLKAS
ncbi:MAG: hypothetical protein AAGA75_19685 [Cyanobacteria bacterium P01_E01_bin.6]